MLTRFRMTVRLTFTTPLLGTVASDPAVFAEYLAKDPAEVADLPNSDEVTEEEHAIVQPTVFFRYAPAGEAERVPVLRDYAVKGFFKDAASMLRRIPGTLSHKEKAYKKTLDGLVFITPRYLALDLAGPLTINSRPLRAQTARGERIAIASSEEAPAGTHVTFTCEVLSEALFPWLKELLDYGAMRGLGQWRNSGAGTYTWEEL